MKLIRLKITDSAGFRSLQKNFEIYFLREWNRDEIGDFNPYILAGPNGSGKSNILEALAAIFYHLECMFLNYRPQSFEYDEISNIYGFRSEIALPNGYELEYYISVHPSLNISNSKEYAHIKILKEQNVAPVVYWVNRELFDVSENIILTGKEIKKILPDFVLGYSSGENEILSLPFFKMRFIHFDEYKDYMINQNSYSSVPEGRLTFLSSEFSQAILLSNLLLQEKVLLKPFTEEIGIEEIVKFRIIIKKYIELEKDDVTDDPENTMNFPLSIVEIYPDEFGEKHFRLNITQNLKLVIQKLENCATSSNYDSKCDELYLDYWVNEATKQAFAYNFNSPIELFQAFQILLTLNQYSVNEKLKKELYHSGSLYVNETIPMLPSDERIMRFKELWLKKSAIKNPILSKSLSDGEHQFIHTLGLCLLYKNSKCLFLLDEPDTHFNPNWRAKFISRIRECFNDELSTAVTREMLITTHTPYLISDSKKEYVLIFNKTNNIEVTRPNYNTFGASINQINIKSFSKTQTIGEFAEKQLNELKKRFEDGESKTDLIEEANQRLGDSVEKVLFINKVLNSEEEE